MYIRATAVMFPIQEASSQETYRTDLHKLRRRKKNQRSTFWLRLAIELRQNIHGKKYPPASLWNRLIYLRS